ncbi:MAG: YggS family pyridoxal phosphate-dependent enzyme [Candidatus Nanopelagicales bacterium]|nr:YggS family pyridoxal phosphate-dependent enzyme [Candidatus Nanopelagicales bacterium]
MSENASFRAKELDQNLQAAHDRIDAVSEGRRVDLLVISKTYPSSDIHILNGLGQHAFGENRDQEGKSKHVESENSDLVSWHMVGQLQSKKLNSIARWADTVETLDRLELIIPLDRAAAQANKKLRVLIQVNLDPVEFREGMNRGGVNPGAVPDFVAELEKAPHLTLGGVMGVGPHPEMGADVDAAFGQLAGAAALVQKLTPEATMISAGMSGDLEQAIRAGATQVRLGSAILGERHDVQ